MRSSASVLAVGNPCKLLRSGVLLSVTNLPRSTTGRHGSRPTAAGLARGPSSRATPSPSWTYLAMKHGDDRQRRRTGPGARVSPRRSARRCATPGTLLRSIAERSPVCGRARLQFLPGSRAPPVHLLGFAARTTRHALCLCDPERSRADQTENDPARGLGGRRSGTRWRGGRRGAPEEVDRRRAGPREGGRHGSDVRRGLPGGRAEQDRWGGATEGPTDEDATRRPGPLRRRWRSALATGRGTSTKARGWRAMTVLERGAQLAGGTRADRWCRPGVW
jgi:hypothetical protein